MGLVILPPHWPRPRLVGRGLSNFELFRIRLLIAMAVQDSVSGPVRRGEYSFMIKIHPVVEALKYYSASCTMKLILSGARILPSNQITRPSHLVETKRMIETCPLAVCHSNPDDTYSPHPVPPLSSSALQSPDPARPCAHSAAQARDHSSHRARYRGTVCDTVARDCSPPST